jgi:hypothetical protein
MTNPELPPSSIPNEEWQRFAQTRYQGRLHAQKTPTSLGMKIIIVLLIPVSLVAVGLIVAFVLSAIATNREMAVAKKAAERSLCASHLKQIGLAVAMFVNANPGKPLPSLDSIAKTEDLSPDVLRCPTNGEPFVYSGKGVTELDATRVLAYESVEQHGAGINFLYGDGLVVWRSSEEASAIILKLKSGKNPPE